MSDSYFTRRRRRDADREQRRADILAPRPMTPEQVADLVQRVRGTSTPDKSHPERWERYRAEQWRPRLKLADVKEMQRRAGGCR